MAKYTDPNTGVKYSTHTGLKVFTVIVVILLAVSIVLNVVLYMQNSDDSELDAESGELYEDDGDGDNSDGTLSENGNGNDGDEDDGDGSEGESFAPPLNPEDYEDYIDTDTVVENDNAVLEDGAEFDENGVAKCIYYFDDCTWYGCEDGCVGHEYYLTTGGGAYSYYPTLYPQVLVGEDGSMDINSEIRVSLVFDTTYNDVDYIYDENDDFDYTDYYYSTNPGDIEIASLTGEPLEIESVELRQHVYYESKYGFTIQIIEHRSNEGKEVELRVSDEVSVFNDYTRTYYYLADDGYFTLTLKTTDGMSYSFSFCISYNGKLDVTSVVYDD